MIVRSTHAARGELPVQTRTEDGRVIRRDIRMSRTVRPLHVSTRLTEQRLGSVPITRCAMLT